MQRYFNNNRNKMGRSGFCIFILLCALGLAPASAQNYSCGTKPSPSLVSYDAANPAGVARLTSLPKANKVFSVYAYICLNKDEQPVTTPADIQVLIDKANAAFAPIGFSFNVCSYFTVPDYRYREIDISVRMQELVDLYYKPEVINMYFTNTATGDIGGINGFGQMLGEADAIVVGDSLSPPDAFSIIHQLGHFFGLYHTFETTAFGVELANGTNCQTTGDLLCDTEADPGNYGPECLHQFPVSDLHGTRYAPPYDNFMSLSDCGCRFTVEQYQRMYTIYTTSRNYLQ